jgi:uncharacterized iron-regulated membrane protein
MMNDSRMPLWPEIRKWFRNIHLWLGIASGLILFVVCLTGTIYTFNVEIQEIFGKNKYKVEVPPNAGQLPAEKLMTTAMESIGKGNIQYIIVSQDKSRAYQINVKKEAPADGIQKKSDTGIYSNRGLNILINPYTGEILGAHEGPLFDFFRTMYKMHRWLLLDTNIGRPIVGVATIIFVVLILSGMVIWIPKKVKAWKQGLKINFRGNWKRINHDLHYSLGFYSSFLLLVMALTGLTWSFEWYKDGFFSILGVARPVQGAFVQKPIRSAIPTNANSAKLTVDQLIETANKILPYSGDYRIVMPSNDSATVTMSKTRSGFFAVRGVDKLQLDQYNGDLLSKDLYLDKPLNEKITSSIKAVHTGEIFGPFSKILYFIACLFATSLPVTGTVMWINDLGKNSGRRTSTKDLFGSPGKKLTKRIKSMSKRTNKKVPLS